MRLDNKVSTAVTTEIRRLRMERDWSTAAMARKVSAAGLDTNSQNVRDLESGRRREVSVDMLLAYAGAFGISPMELLNGQLLTEER